MGYSERAFCVALPFDREQEQIELTEECFSAWFLDGIEHPEHYKDKTLILDCQVDIQEDGNIRRYIAGRNVMTCCMADIQFLGFPLKNRHDENTDVFSLSNRCWIHLEATGQVSEHAGHIGTLILLVQKLRVIPPAGVPVIGGPKRK